MMRPTLLAALLASGASLADEAPDGFYDRPWRISGHVCIRDCPKPPGSFAMGLAGTPVRVERDSFASSFADDCPSGARYAFERRPRAEAVAELKRTFGPGATVDDARLRLPRGALVSGRVACGSGAQAATVARFLSVEPDRMLLLAEDGVVLVAVPEGR